MLAVFARVHGLAVSGWQRAVTGNAAVVWLHDDVVVKVHRPGVDADLLGRRIAVCDAARADGARIVDGGFDGASGPFAVDGWTVTVWERHPLVPATASGLGAALASLHHSTAARGTARAVALPPARHVRAEARWRPRWDQLDPAAAAILGPWVTWAHAAAAVLVDGTVVHGDVNHHNALGGDDAVLIDVDAFGVAWAAADVAAARNCTDPREWPAFVDGYGPMPDTELVEVSALVLRVANSALWDAAAARAGEPGAARRLREHLELFAASAPPAVG